MSVDTTSLVAGLGAQITGAIKQAAAATGASFEYLLSAAKMESNFNPAAAAPTSSARGLYQFIDQTWLATVKEAGASLGYGQYADAITRSASGTYSVSDPAARAEILKLRDDPAVSAAMAGVLTQSNSFNLTQEIGRRPSDAELYMAHFMGVGGASKLITAAEETPQANAARMFPSAAAANRPIFYDRNGNARSVSEVYALLDSRYASAANFTATQTAVSGPAASAASQSASPTVAGPSDSNAFFLSAFPQTTAFVAANAAAAPAAAAGAMAALAQAAPVPSVAPVPTPTPPSTLTPAPISTASPSSPSPNFRSLFQVGDRVEPLSSAVHALWGSASSTDAAAPAQGQVAPQPLDLFSDRTGIFSS